MTLTPILTTRNAESVVYSVPTTTELSHHSVETEFPLDLPPRICVAISPNELYLFGMKAHADSLDPIAKIDRDKLGVEVQQRMTVRTIVLEDLETGHQFPLEAPKFNFNHAKAMVELLKMNEEHYDEEVEEVEEEEIAG
jgi:hypothetical protein